MDWGRGIVPLGAAYRPEEDCIGGAGQVLHLRAQGSALFVDGKLVPNLEAAHHPFRKGQTYEENLGRAALDKAGKKKWRRRVVQAIASLEHLFNYDTLYIGGGNAKKIKVDLPPNVKLVPNVAGLLGGIALWRD